MRSLSIGDVASSSETPASTIRYYEQIGLLPAPDRVNGRRRYSEGILWRLRLIQGAKRAGLSLDAIRRLFSRQDIPLRQRWEQVAAPRLDQIDDQIRELEVSRDSLLETLACQCQTLEECATSF